MQITDFLQEKLEATPQSMAESKKDSEEEVADRHERVVASCLRALAELLRVAGRGSGAGGSGGNKGAEGVAAGAEAIVSRPGFFKAHLANKSAMVGPVSPLPAPWAPSVCTRVLWQRLLCWLCCE